LTRQIAETVQWQRCVEYAKNMGVNNWVVVGPSKVLGNLLKKEYTNDIITSISTVEDIVEYGERLRDER
jgi:[acyl-carrier-protein] S-malonyltransferase